MYVSRECESISVTEEEVSSFRLNTSVAFSNKDVHKLICLYVLRINFATYLKVAQRKIYFAGYERVPHRCGTSGIEYYSVLPRMIQGVAEIVLQAGKSFLKRQ